MYPMMLVAVTVMPFLQPPGIRFFAAYRELLLPLGILNC